MRSSLRQVSHASLLLLSVVTLAVSLYIPPSVQADVLSRGQVDSNLVVKRGNAPSKLKESAVDDGSHGYHVEKRRNIFRDHGHMNDVHIHGRAIDSSLPQVINNDKRDFAGGGRNIGNKKIQAGEDFKRDFAGGGRNIGNKKDQTVESEKRDFDGPGLNIESKNHQIGEEFKRDFAGGGRNIGGKKDQSVDIKEREFGGNGRNAGSRKGSSSVDISKRNGGLKHHASDEFSGQKERQSIHGKREIEHESIGEKRALIHLKHKKTEVSKGGPGSLLKRDEDSKDEFNLIEEAMGEKRNFEGNNRNNDFIVTTSTHDKSHHKAGKRDEELEDEFSLIAETMKEKRNFEGNNRNNDFSDLYKIRHPRSEQEDGMNVSGSLLDNDSLKKRTFENNNRNNGFTELKASGHIHARSEKGNDVGIPENLFSEDASEKRTFNLEENLVETHHPVGIDGLLGLNGKKVGSEEYFPKLSRSVPRLDEPYGNMTPDHHAYHL